MGGWGGYCQGMYWFRELFVCTELANDELSSIHTQPATPALVTINEQPIILLCKP